MSIKLPAMRLLCYRWELPASISEACDYYFLDRPTFPDFADSLHIKNARLHITKHGVDFEVVFQNGAEVAYADCIKKELDGDPCVQVTFWCSFRSLTFEWAGVTHTRAVVLVQPARAKVRSREPKREPLLYGTPGLGKSYAPDPKPYLVSHATRPATSAICINGTTFADRVANSLDKMEKENDNT